MGSWLHPAVQKKTTSENMYFITSSQKFDSWLAMFFVCSWFVCPYSLWRESLCVWLILELQEFGTNHPALAVHAFFFCDTALLMLQAV
jgi:hypothetical protein